MKKLLLILLCLPMIGFGQTLIPDANFEQALINLGYDIPPINGSVIILATVFLANLFSKNNDWTINELAALVKSLEVLAMSDGNYDSKEEKYILDKMNELKKWKNQAEFISFQDKLNSLSNPQDSITILSGMTDDKKKIVADTLLELSLIDGNCDGEELVFQRFLLSAIGWKEEK